MEIDKKELKKRIPLNLLSIILSLLFMYLFILLKK